MNWTWKKNKAFSFLVALSHILVESPSPKQKATASCPNEEGLMSSSDLNLGRMWDALHSSSLQYDYKGSKSSDGK